MLNQIPGKFIWKSAASLVFVLVCVFPAYAGPKAVAENKDIKLGNVKAGAIAETFVELRNEGDEPLEIERVQTSCPCAEVEELTEELSTIPPGGTRKLKVTYDTKDLFGDHGAVVVVYTNDPENPVVLYDISLHIEIVLVVRPPKGIFWGMAPRGTEVNKELTFIPGEKSQDIELLDIEIEKPGMTVTTERTEHKGQPRIVAHFTVEPDAPMGEMRNIVHAKVRVGEEKLDVSLPLGGRIIGDLFIIPPAIISPKTARPQGGYISEITVGASDNGPPPDVLGAIAVGPLKAVIHPNGKENAHVIAVHAADDAPAGPQSGCIHVMTSSKDQPITTIPVYWKMGQAVVAEPCQVVIDMTKGIGATQRIELRNVNTSAVAIKDVRYEQDLLRVDVVSKAQTGAEQPAVIEVAPNAIPDRTRLASMIVVVTDCPGAEELRLPVAIRPPAMPASE